jgi:hypothetical protein
MFIASLVPPFSLSSQPLFGQAAASLQQLSTLGRPGPDSRPYFCLYFNRPSLLDPCFPGPQRTISTPTITAKTQGTLSDYRHCNEQVHPDNSDDAYHQILAHSTTNSYAFVGNIHLLLF